MQVNFQSVLEKTSVFLSVQQHTLLLPTSPALALTSPRPRPAPTPPHPHLALTSPSPRSAPALHACSIL